MDTEWVLADWAFRDIIREFWAPQIDLFASRLNKKCILFCSWHCELGAYCTDAFTISWSGLKCYAFPPFELILRTIRKIQLDQAQGIVVAPYWPTQAWFPLWERLLVSKPLIFDPDDDLLLSNCRQFRHRLAKKMPLMAGLLSGKRLKN